MNRPDDNPYYNNHLASEGAIPPAPILPPPMPIVALRSQPESYRFLSLEIPGYNIPLLLRCWEQENTGISMVLDMPERLRGLAQPTLKSEEDHLLVRLSPGAPIEARLDPTQEGTEQLRGWGFGVVDPGGELKITGGGGRSPHSPLNASLSGSCKRVEVSLDPVSMIVINSEFEQFEISAGWGGVAMTLEPRTQMVGRSHLFAEGAAWLNLPLGLAKVEVPEGWLVLCREVEHPSCNQWGPVTLEANKMVDPSALIELEGPRGVVLLRPTEGCSKVLDDRANARHIVAAMLQHDWPPPCESLLETECQNTYYKSPDRSNPWPLPWRDAAP